MKHTPGRPMAGRTVLVTGATSGIGRATALGLATMGAHIAITGRGRGRTEDAAREIRAAGGLNVDASCSPISWPEDWSEAQSPPMRCIPASCGHLSELKILPASSDS